MDILKTIGVFAIAVLLGLSAYVAGQKLGPAPIQPQPGAISSPDLISNYIGFGGIEYTSNQMALTAATTTPCVIQSPAGTTTLEAFTFNVTTPTSSAATITIATSTVLNATTSLVASQSISASVQATLNWHGGNNNALVAPNTYVSAGASGVTLGGYTFGGTCSATFRSVN